jgi:hypothetical protein
MTKTARHGTTPFGKSKFIELLAQHWISFSKANQISQLATTAHQMIG